MKYMKKNRILLVLFLLFVALFAFQTEAPAFLGFHKSKSSEQKEVVYLATNPDLVCPVSFGYVPDCGSISIMIRNATGRCPRFIGKPEPTMIQIVMDKFGYRPEQTVVVGDRVYTDIASGFRANATTIGVLSGESTIEDFRNAKTPPTFLFGSVREIWKAVQA